MASGRNYRRPTRVRVCLWDPLARFMIRRGVGGTSADGSGMRILDVRGRRTGRRYQRPVAVSAVDGLRYIVSICGESQWVRNLRAPAPDANLRLGRRLEPVEAHELGDGEAKAAVLLAVCRRSPAIARRHYGVDPQTLTLEQAREVAARYPIFRIEARPAATPIATPASISV
jgi:deazaflavin-dependent oxidoreductase (nitroreductase family)